jgi:hypothetical protein
MLKKIGSCRQPKGSKAATPTSHLYTTSTRPPAYLHHTSKVLGNTESDKRPSAIPFAIADEVKRRE